MSSRRVSTIARRTVLALVCGWTAGAVGALAPAQGTWRASVDSSGSQVYPGSQNSDVSADGRFVAFASHAPGLVPQDTNGELDVFVHDRHTGSMTRVSVSTSGVQGNMYSSHPSISGDGRHVAFAGMAMNLVPDDGGFEDVFVRDRQSGTTILASVDSSEVPGNKPSSFPAISQDGRYVAFHSSATNLVPGDTNNETDVFVRDLQAGTTTRVSVSSEGVQSWGGFSAYPSLSADGRFVVFASNASNLVADDTNWNSDVFVHDLQTSTTTRVSVGSSGEQGNWGSHSGSVSADGRVVAFSSSADTLVAGDDNGERDVFVRDLETGETTRVSVASSGEQGDAVSWHPEISADGRVVVFQSEAATLVSGDTNGSQDVFAHDREGGTTTRVSVDSSLGQAGDDSSHAAVSADGNVVVFESVASDLVSGDTNASSDVFVHERQAQAPMLTAQPSLLSLAAGGTQHFTLQAGPQPPSNLYLLLGSASGTGPGIWVDGALLPLAPDAYLLHSIANAGGSVLVNTVGSLLPDGTAPAPVEFRLPAGLNPGLAGTVLHHAYLAFDLASTTGAAVVASNPVFLRLVP